MGLFGNNKNNGNKGLGFRGVYCNNTDNKCCARCKNYKDNKCKNDGQPKLPNYWCTGYTVK